MSASISTAVPAVPMRPPQRASRHLLVIGGIALTAALLVAGAFMPKWLTFLVTMAASHGLVSLGIVLMMRGGVVSFGQGLVFAIGAYAAALAYTRLGITDALGLALLGGVVATLAAALGVVERLQDVLPEKRGRLLRLTEWFSPNPEVQTLPQNPRSVRPVPPFGDPRR